MKKIYVIDVYTDKVISCYEEDELVEWTIETIYYNYFVSRIEREENEIRVYVYGRVDD